MKQQKLGEILIASGAVSEADIEAALADQSAGEPARLGDLLVATGKLTSAQLAHALAEQYQLPFLELPPLPQAVIDLVPLELQRAHRFVPLRSDDTELSIAMADLSNLEVVGLLEQQWTKVHVYVAAGDEIDALHATLSGVFGHPTAGVLPGGVVPGIAPLGGAPTADDLFGSLDLSAETELPALEPLPAVEPLDAAPAPLKQIPTGTAVYGRFDPGARTLELKVPDELFGSSVLPAPARPSPAPAIAPVQPVLSRPSPAPQSSTPKMDELFGDLNLESARTGIPARPPEETAAVIAAAAPTLEVPIVGGAAAEPAATGVSEVSGPILEGIREGTGPVIEGVREGTGPVVEGVREVSGPILDGIREGTGPVIEGFHEGTGPVVDVAFFGDLPAPSAPQPIQDLPFDPPTDSPMSVVPIKPTIAPPPPRTLKAAPAGSPTLPELAIPPEVVAAAPAPAADGEALPAWLAGGEATDQPLVVPAAPQSSSAGWTGALDHLAPSKVAFGVARALIARGLLTEQDILDAVGKKK